MSAPLTAQRALDPQPMEREEYGCLLNTLLEAERVGAKLLAAYADELPLDSRGWTVLLPALSPALLLAGAMLTFPAAVVADPTAAEIEANRRRIAELHKNPEKLQKLRAEAATFLALPEERRRQITEIDEALARQPPLHAGRGLLDRRLQGPLQRDVPLLPGEPAERLGQLVRQDLAEPGGQLGVRGAAELVPPVVGLQERLLDDV